jgi:hypothetical protein
MRRELFVNPLKQLSPLRVSRLAEILDLFQESLDGSVVRFK